MGVIGDNPGSVEALSELATVECLEGKYNSGLALVEEILMIDPENSAALGKRDLIRTRIGINVRPSSDLEWRNALLQQDRQPSLPVRGSELPARAPDIPANPKISIIIPVFNQVGYTKQCIEAIWATCRDQEYEILVVDDCSGDETPEFLQSVKKHVRSYRNETNQGFILNCNFAATQARGEYIVLLNNDTIPQNGWLEGLLEPFHLYDNVAATGALMIHPDNKILEACSIVFSDGSGWNYGRGDYPNSPRYNFIREVDYVPGGGMMVPRKIWNDLGGLDTHYCPAYYDDIDFCFRARKAGYKVLYTPFSRIIHFEGMTGGTDVTKGVKRYQVVNRDKFAERWKDELKAQYENKYENVFRASWRGSGKRILWIDHVLPLPNFNSGCLRMNYLMKSLVKLGHKITYIALSNSDPENYSNVMRKMGVEAVSLGYESWHHSKREGEIVDKVLDLLEVRNNNYDVVYLSFYWVAMLFIRKIRRRLPSAIVYVDSHDIHFLRTKREAELHKDRAHIARAKQTKIEELGVYSRADAVLTVTELDKQALLKELPEATVFLMPNVHDVVPVECGFHERRDLLFVGGFNHAPNVDSMLYFCREVFPKVREKIPGMKLWIVGSNPPGEVKALANDSVMVTGWVKDTKPYLDRCRISIAPLRYGAGMKGKVGEAMCHGLPVITTSVGSEGMGIANDEHAIIVDRVDEWVDQIVRLYNDEKLWNKLSANGQALMSKHYGSEEMLRRAKHILSFNSRNEVAALSPLPATRMKTSLDVSVSIVVVTYNQLAYTKKCISSVKQWTKVPHRIIVVDNCSTDGTQRYLQRMAKKKVIHRLILNEHNVGFPAAVNQAINVAQGQYILLLNNDTVVTLAWLERLIETAESDPRIGIVGPMSNAVSGVQRDTTATYKDLASMHQHAATVARVHKGEIFPFPRVAFLCTLIKRELIEKIGGLDERFTPGNFEDDDFCLRAQLAWYKTAVVKDVFIHHYGSKSFGAEGNDAYTERIEANRKVFIDKWGADPIEIWKDKREFKKRNIKYPINKDLFIQHFERAKNQLEEKEPALALASLRKAIEYFHSSERRSYAVGYADVLDLAGNVALLIGDMKTAKAYFEEELTVAPESPRVAAGLEKVRHAEPDTGGSKLPVEMTMEKVEQKGTAAHKGEMPAVQRVIDHGRELIQRGLIDKAVGVLQEGIKLAPNNTQPYRELAWLFIKNKMFEDASALIESTPETIKKDIEWLEIAGYCMEGQGMDDVANQCADKVLELQPLATRALTLKGILATKAGKDHEARRFFSQAIEHGGAVAEPHAHLGALLWRSGDREEGFNLLEKAFVLDPTDGDIALTYYSAAESLGRLEDAEWQLKEASALYPINKRLKHFVADVLSRRGKYPEAMQAIEEAILLFGAEGHILPFALETRRVVGQKEITLRNGERETVSLCMIVKNEEAYVAQCLSSVKAVVDEIIVVDTGSNDKTKQIAEAFGAKVFDFAWIDDFSAARNFSLSHASGSWILILDADEVLSPIDHARIRNMTSSKRDVAYSFTTRNYVTPTDIQGWMRNDGKYKEEAGTGWISSVKVRLFPRRSSIRFEHAVHELVEASLISSNIEVKSSPVPIHHYGKLDLHASRKKGESYLELGEMKLEETGSNNMKALSELAIQENELGNYQRALEICLRLVELDPRNPRAHMGVGSNYIGLNRFHDALQPLKKSMELDPNLKEAYIRHSIALLVLGKAQEAVPVLEKLARIDPDYPYSRAMLAAALFCLGEKEKGMQCVGSMERDNIRFDQFFADLAKQLKSNGRVDYAVAMLEPLADNNYITQELGLVLVESYKKQALVN
jgi:GT2 family glycosyltransferase/Flp pilus assembly protein TadD